MSSNGLDNATWQQQTIEKLLMETVKEQRRARRWRIFFRFIILAYIGVFIVLLVPSKNVLAGASKPHVAVIHINGVIADDSAASSDNIIDSLDDAFANKNTKAVVLDINSPGGSPVQADNVYQEVKRLRNKKPDIKVYAVCEDICASGAYYIAASADDIYANPSSLVGSIGVLMNGFGFVDAMQKIGVERRLMTSGSNKGILDPFSPVNPHQQVFVQQMLDEVHQIFIDRVKAGRGNRLNTQDPNLFSGLFWTGEDAKKLGLIDGMMTLGDVARNIVKVTNMVDYTEKPSFFDRFAGNMGSEMAHQFMSALTKVNLR